MAKTLYLSSQNTVDCYKSFCSVFKFWSPTQFFFLSWNNGSIIPLVSINYLALVHNYNSIKYICFISPQQHADMNLAFYENASGHIVKTMCTQYCSNIYWHETFLNLLYLLSCQLSLNDNKRHEMELVHNLHKYMFTT